MDRLTKATSDRFGYAWAGAPTPTTAPVPYHLEVTREALGAPPLSGRVLDAGCGEGTDLAWVSLDPSVRAVGVELSVGGSRASRVRAPGAEVVQGDLRCLPFRDASFDAIYSYGVIHHTTDPAVAVREIVRTLRPGGMLLVYLYEDFEDRSAMWRVGLRATGLVRVVTARLPPRAIMALCRVAAPFVYATCTLPARRFQWARRLPYHHCETRRSLVSDLYDRLAPSIEYRYSRAGAIDLLRGAGVDIRAVAQQRGWMLWAQKP